MDEKLRNIIDLMLEQKNTDKKYVINESTNMRDDLGFDSFDLAELTVRVEDEYSIDVFEEGIVNTVGEILDKLNK
jgi:acyl carrier protein